jgi:ABC-type multidrug transport system ATPase subunit
MLRIEVQSLRIGRRLLSKSMSIEVPAGRIHLLKGPNGCGKSLLLDAIVGVHRSSGVQVRLDDRLVSGTTAFKRWRAGLRRMFQAPTLPFELEVEQVLKRFGFDRASVDDWWSEASDLLEACDVRSHEPIRIHSFGQQRIIELVVALSSGRCCLLDEPFAGINSLFVDPAIKLIRHAANDGRAILVIDHLSAQHPELYDEVYAWKSPDASTSILASEKASRLLSEFGSRYTDLQPVGAHWHVEHFRIGDNTILRDAEIELPKSTFLLLTGGNGTGKSTLLRELGVYGQPWEGVSAEITGNPETRDMLLSPQPPKLVDELTAEENLKLMLGKGGAVSKSDRAFAIELLGWMGLSTKHLKARAEVLSGGEAGMVALVGASLNPAEILLLDEPFESFSPQVVDRGIELLKGVTSAGKSVIASTHDPQIVQLVDPSQVIDLSHETALTGRWVGRPFA